MTSPHEYLIPFRQQELVREAQRARLVGCLRRSRPGRRLGRRPCA
jgi:hypothetical protein